VPLRLPAGWRITASRRLQNLTSDKEKQYGQSDRGGDGSDVHLPRLAAHLSQYLLVLDGLDPGVHVARPARSQRHSGLVTRLKVPDAGHHKGQEENGAPPRIRPDHNEESSQPEAEGQRDEPKGQSAALFLRTDIRNADGFVGWVLRHAVVQSAKM